jgi:putative hydrolase of the HAD superfamily
MKLKVKRNFCTETTSIDFFVGDNTFFCFDLDDTLYKEIDYLKSAYKEIAQKLFGQNWQKNYEVMLNDFVKKKMFLENLSKAVKAKSPQLTLC